MKAKNKTQITAELERRKQKATANVTNEDIALMLRRMRSERAERHASYLVFRRMPSHLSRRFAGLGGSYDAS